MGSKNNPAKYDCLSKAEPDEPYFVLLGRDPIASFVVSLWASLNHELSKGESHTTDKNAEALACAEAMVAWAREHGKEAEMDRVADLFFKIIAGEKSREGDVPPLRSGISRVSYDADAKEVSVIVTEEVPASLLVSDSGLRLNVSKIDEAGWGVRVEARRVAEAPQVSGDDR